MNEDAAARIVRDLLERYVSEDESGEYQLHVKGDAWRRFCAELEASIREALA